MHGPRISALTGACAALLLAMAAIAGCHSDGDCVAPCNDIPPGAIPQPSGTYACQWIHAEMARAEQDYFVIYNYEWSADPVKLSPFGEEHVGRLAQRIDRTPYPIVIEPSPDDRVNAARQAEIVAALAKRQVAIGPDRVVLGRSEAEGLYGEEAPGIAATMLSSGSGGRGVGAGFSGTQSGTFGPSQGGIFGTTQMPVPAGSAPGGGIGIGIGGY